MIELLIPGQPIVKKGTQQVVRMRNGRSIVVYSKAYKRWLQEAGDHLLQQLHKKPPHPIDYPINLQCRFYRKTLGTVDLSALYEGIQDALVSHGWLADDNWKVVASHDGSGVFHDKHNPRMEIVITPKEGQ